MKWYGHEENERAHGEKNDRCGHTGEKKKRATKPKTEICVQGRYGINGAEMGKHNKQGSMEEEDKQLYRRPQMTGQARDDEAEESKNTLVKANNKSSLYSAIKVRIHWSKRFTKSYVDISWRQHSPCCCH